MPELPEVETVVRQLHGVLEGKTIADVSIRRAKSLQGDVFRLVGKKIAAVGRKQKMIVIELEKSEDVLLIHLKMTGQLIYIPSKPRNREQVAHAKGEVTETRIVGGHPTKDWVSELPSKHTRVVIQFSEDSCLYFNDQRVFGWMRVVAREAWLEMRARMAPDVVDESFTVKYLRGVLERLRRPVKLVILDQDKIGGMGNIYANDALYLAKIHPLTPSIEIKPNRVKKLYHAMKQVIAKGIETGGASLSHFVDTEGMGGHYQDHFLVYGKAGESCVVCGSVIVKISTGGRGTYFCPKCQIH